MKDDFFIELTEGFAKITDSVGIFVKGIGGLQGILSGLGIILMKTFGP
jgi:hypothetical protein